MSEILSAFVKPDDYYQRDLKAWQDYVKDTANYLHTITKRPIHECDAFVRQLIGKGGRFEFQDPQVEFLRKNEEGDRERAFAPMTKYLGHVISENEVLAPTFTTYVDPAKEESLLAVYQDTNVKLRSKAKKEMFAALNAGNKLLGAIKKLEQGNKKTSNNSISGAHLSPSTPLHNKTAHSSLTSTCRITAGFGNANNEKFLSGNRHYYNHHVTLNNMVVLAHNNDLEEMQRAVDKWSIAIPSAEDVIECIRYSTDLYWTGLGWQGNYHFDKVIRLAKSLTPIQRCAVVYTGDLHHLKKHNDKLVFEFFDKLTTKVWDKSYDAPFKNDKGEEVLPALRAIKAVPESFVNYAVQVCSKETVGMGDKLHEIPYADLCVLAGTCEHIAAVVEEYRDLIQAFWVTPNFPASVAYFPDSIRRAALTSDTDSTIFTVQDWVKWFKGKISFDDQSMRVAAAAIFLTSETITHLLGMLSANIGVARKHLHRIAMKNEFKFDVFVPTQLGKHYFATISCQEGNVKRERETEIKGVGLKASNISRDIMKSAQRWMEALMNDVIQNGEIELRKYLDWVAREELAIFDSLARGETKYLRLGSIKDPASYTKEDPMETPFAHHVFWDKVFSPKYGEIAPPPYPTHKVSVALGNPTLFRQWLSALGDQDLSARMVEWCKDQGKNKYTTFHVPAQVIEKAGIPLEISSVMNQRKIVSDICKVFYILLEVLGVYLFEKKMTRLVTDSYSEEERQRVRGTTEETKQPGDGDLIFIDAFGEEHDADEVFDELVTEDEED